MSEYINFEPDTEFIDADCGKEDDEVSFVSDNNSFIDDQELNDDINFYRQYEFVNVESNTDQVLAEAHNEALADIEHFDEISNLCDGSDYEAKIVDFKESEIDLTKFKETLFPRVENENQFYKAILYAIKFDKNNCKNVCTRQDFEKFIDKNFIEQIDQPEKFKFIIELQAFTNMCFEINSILLSKFGYFLRVFELKNKFHHLTVKNGDEKKIVRQLSSCLIEKCNGFTIISVEYQKKEVYKKYRNRTTLLLFRRYFKSILFSSFRRKKRFKKST